MPVYTNGYCLYSGSHRIVEERRWSLMTIGKLPLPGMGTCPPLAPGSED